MYYAIFFSIFSKKWRKILRNWPKPRKNVCSEPVFRIFETAALCSEPIFSLFFARKFLSFSKMDIFPFSKNVQKKKAGVLSLQISEKLIGDPIGWIYCIF
jgi:hypothetical protein